MFVLIQRHHIWAEVGLARRGTGLGPPVGVFAGLGPPVGVFLSVYPLLKTLRTSDYDVISDVCVDSASLATSFKKCNVIMT